MVTMFPPVLQLQPECSQDAPFTNHIPSPISQILKRPGCWEMTVQIFSWQNSRVSNRNLLNLRNLRNLWLNSFSVFGFKVQTEMVRLHRAALVSCASLILTPMAFRPGSEKKMKFALQGQPNVFRSAPPEIIPIGYL